MIHARSSGAEKISRSVTAALCRGEVGRLSCDLNGLSLKGSKLSRGVKTILGFTDTR